MGVVGNAETFLPLMKHERAKLILETAYKLSGLQRSAQNIATAADRAAKVVFALKSYSRYDQSGEMTSADIAEGMDTVLTLYQSHLKHGVEVVRDYEEVPRILCLPDELNQVWTNLIHNSLQAMDYKGTLEIGVSKRDGSIAVSVTDSGPGIPDDVREKIFEPFFTTKPAGEGTGLGLDIVKKIVDKHDGRIEVDSKPGRTTMCVILPMRTRGAKEA